MSVKVTTPTKNTFGSGNLQVGPSDNSGNSTLTPTNLNTFASKLDDIVKFAVGRNKSADSKPSSTSKNPQNVRKNRRFSEKGHSPYSQQNKKKGKHEKQKDKFKLPTKFLLGGNISDPLNLNSLNDEEINKALNAFTPVSSPLPTPAHRQQKVEVLIPPNINDPLNLNSGGDDIGLISPRSSCKKRKKNKRKKSGGELNISGDGSGQDTCNDFYSPLSLQIDPKVKVFADEIVSPAIPQDSPKHKKKKIDFKANDGKVPESKLLDKQKIKKQVSSVPLQKPKFRPQDSKFIHGNYNRYYGKRNPGMVEDDRLNNFQTEWFDAKDVLDIGCNIGHITLSIAKRFTPKSIVGMDIDPKLISVARKNVRHYMTADGSSVGKFPVSLPTTYGPVEAPTIGHSSDGKPQFPDNINFVQGNYVIDSDELLDLQTEEFDVILALSITKWIHLNNGDSGLKRAFRRMYKQLRPGGRLILEPQPRRTYKKKKNLTETIWKNFHEIQLWPEKFRSYLLSPEVGFMKCDFLEVPFNKSKGFQRPIIVFTKAETRPTTPREVTESRGVTPLMNIDCGGHSFTPRFDDPNSHTATPNYDLHPSFSFSSQHMPIRGYDAFLENQVNRAFTPTQELIAVTARTVTPRFDIGTPSVSARNTPSHTIQCSETDSNDRWVHSQGSAVDEQLFDQLNEDDNDCDSLQAEEELVKNDDTDTGRDSSPKIEKVDNATVDKDVEEESSSSIPDAKVDNVSTVKDDESLNCEMDTNDDSNNKTGCCYSESSSQKCSDDNGKSGGDTMEQISCNNKTDVDSVNVNNSSQTSENRAMQTDSTSKAINVNISEKTEEISSVKLSTSENVTNDNKTIDQ